ncbi:hypothetical protein, partial [Aliiroseovarius lamellibrachiae]|uniref:hypothetical protein n=1 Tax=Aliiroseovarius lamellibrachiae TaxID=1924933 RepID=UPI001BDF8517
MSSIWCSICPTNAASIPNLHVETDSQISLSSGRWGQRTAYDGHHRAAAYHLREARGEATIKVPVEAHPNMPLNAAIGAASKLNGREKVTITRAEKGNAAWKMVCEGSGSIAELVKWSGVSKQQISIMRGVLKRLRERGISTSQMIDQGWDWSRDTDKSKSTSEFTENAAEAMAQDWAERIGKALGGKAVDNPGVVARALEIISPALPSRMIESDAFWDALNGAGRNLLEEFDLEEEDSLEGEF